MANVVDFRGVKAWAHRALKPDDPLREAVLCQPDMLSASEFVELAALLDRMMVSR